MRDHINDFDILASYVAFGTGPLARVDDWPTPPPHKKVLNLRWVGPRASSAGLAAFGRVRRRAR